MMEHSVWQILTFDSLCFSSLDRKADFSNTCLSCNTDNALGIIMRCHIQFGFVEK